MHAEQVPLQTQKDHVNCHKYKIEKACNRGMTFKVITIYYINRIQASLLVIGLLLQHLYLTPFSTPRY